MATKTSTPERRSARERLLDAAEQLFYEEGVNTVGIDRVIERAGVAKASLYDSFGSKEELIRSYLAGRHAARQVRIESKLAHYTTPRERVLAVFDSMSDLFAERDFRGCAFIRASAEARTGSSVKAIVDQSRTWLRSLFAELARDAGAADPEGLAQQFVLLYDGASVSAQIDGNRGAAASARAAAALMLDASIAARTPAESR
jgi:AcrR family transcriptional regulator